MAKKRVTRRKSRKGGVVNNNNNNRNNNGANYGNRGNANLNAQMRAYYRQQYPERRNNNNNNNNNRNNDWTIQEEINEDPIVISTNNSTRNNGAEDPILVNNVRGGRRKTQKKFKKPKNGDMFLDYVATGRTDLVEEYLDNGGDPKVINCKGETALHIATAHHQNEILARLLPYFSEDELDLRNMYGLPIHMTAIKYGNNVAVELINMYYKSIRTKPYKFKNYSFKKSIQKKIGKPQIKNIINELSPSNLNPVIYPNQNIEESINLWTYMPKRQSFTNKSPFIPIYNNKNIKVLKINNKPRRTRKKKSVYDIKQVNK
jgi:hypothetical protein